MMAVSRGVIIAFTVTFLAISISAGWFYTILRWSACIIVIIIGSLLGASIAICKGKKYSPPPSDKEPSIANMVLLKMVQHRQNFQPCQTSVITTRGLDQAIQELMDLFIRDYILVWYQNLAADHERFPHLLQDEIWAVVDRLTQRLQRINLVNFMTKDVCDALTLHFEEIRRSSQTQGGGNTKAPTLKLHPWLQSEAHETTFLRQLIEVCMLYLVSKPYLTCTPMRHLIRELLTCSLLQPGVELICDPDYLNHKLLDWLEWREGLYHEHVQLARSTSHDDLLSVINSCENIDKLKQIRYNILSDIMKATTITNCSLKVQESGPDTDVSPTITNKTDILTDNTAKSIEQMKEAKSMCEKKIFTLGGPDYKSYAMLEEDQQQLPDKKVLSFQALMDNSSARNYFLRFLHKNREDMLLRFWSAVDTMKHSAQKLWHEQAGEIYQVFISQPSSVVRSHLHRATIKGMESFMTGDTGPNAFYSAQEQIYNVLGDRHYPSFILSDMYEKYTQAEAVAREERRKSVECSGLTGNKSKLSPEKPFQRSRILAHSTYAQKKVKNLEEKIMNKSQALKALKVSQKDDQKMIKLQEEIKTDLDVLKSDRHNLESHVEKTEHWIDNVGLWTAYIYNAEIVQEEDKMVPYFAIVVHLPGVAVSHDSLVDRTATSQGWVVAHKLDDFHALHQKLVEIKPEYKKKELPTVRKFRIKSIDTEFVNKAKAVLEKYLIDVLKDDRLAQCEALFAFFSSSPEHLKQAPDLPRLPDVAQRPTTLSRSRFSFVSILKSLSTKAEQESDSEDELLFGDEESAKDEITRDSIAEPLYGLVGEVFELRGVFKLLRRTLMTFVQITFGRSINRQLRETVEWLYCESMLIYYLKLFRESYWPGGELAKPNPPRSDEEKLRRRKLAKEKLLQNIPDALKNLVGEQNSRRGAIKIFEAMQDIRLNKQIFYALVERLMLEIFPELLQSEKEASV